ncbi:hypothetical protein (mitochondrion) [Candida oxycetoniae]|uniref:Uncharacterized protein n=1 Tax=Candida oxycetoniae TaxID=497107 RepID=S5TFU7_9ASCO|nr:hypothetical protein [Candida oxycetoniae]AGS44327.1 hypothetical protein [Candida oxycetoniae]
MNKQLTYVNSLAFRLFAVDKLSKYRGSRTFGIDNIYIKWLDSDKELYQYLVELLKSTVKYPKNYKADIVKRVWIPKANGKLRPISIPTLRYRALQLLINLVLEPLIEMTSDPHSFGFRPYRSSIECYNLS